MILLANKKVATLSHDLKLDIQTKSQNLNIKVNRQLPNGLGLKSCRAEKI